MAAVTVHFAEDYPGRVLGLPREGPWSLAGRGDRFCAWLGDFGLGGVVALMFEWMLNARFLALTLMAVNLVVLPYLYGGSLGKLANGMRVVPIVHRGPVPEGLRERWFGGTAAPLEGLAFWQAVVRGLQYALWLVTETLYVLSLLGTDRNRQTPWDRLSRTAVVYWR